MNKLEFLARLQTYLTFMDIVERNQTLEFYAEQIDDRIDDGMTELQAVASLETPEDIAVNLQQMRLNVHALDPKPLVSSPVAPIAPTAAPLTTAPTHQSNASSATTSISPWLKGALVVVALIITSPVWIGLLGTVFGIIIAIFSVLIASVCASFAVAIAALAAIISSAVQICAQPDALARLAYGGSFLGALGVLCLSIVLIYVIVRFIAFLFTKGTKSVMHAISRARAARKAKKAAAPIAHTAAETFTQPVPPNCTTNTFAAVSTTPISPSTYDRTMCTPPRHTAANSLSHTSETADTSPVSTSILNQPLMVVEPGTQAQVIPMPNDPNTGQEVRHD